MANCVLEPPKCQTTLHVNILFLEGGCGEEGIITTMPISIFIVDGGVAIVIGVSGK
jgi:hypothetical protein